MKRKVLILFLGLVSSLTFAQKQLNIEDSLKGKSPEDKVLYLLKMKVNKPLDSALLFINEAIDVAKTHQKDSLFLEGYYQKALTYYNAQKFKKSVAICYKLDSLSQQKSILYYQYKSYNSLGKANFMLSNKNESLKYFKKALSITKEKRDSLSMATIYHNIAGVYLVNNFNKKAEQYYRLALKIYNQANIEEKKKRGTYLQLSRLTSTFEETKVLLNKIEEIDKGTVNPHRDANFQLTKGEAFRVKGDAFKNKKYYYESKKALRKAYRIADSINDREVKNLSLLFLARVNTSLKQYHEAAMNVSSALQLEQPNSINYGLLLDIGAEANSLKNDYKKAYELMLLKKELLDSIQKEETKRSFAEFDVRYKTAEKDKQIAEQKLKIVQEKNSKNLWVGVSILVLVVIILIFQVYFAKQKRKKITVENELEKAKEIEIVRTELLGNISHEIRTPLTLIIGNLQLAQEEKTRNKKLSNYINKALASSKKVIEDSNQILELLKFEKNKQELQETAIAITPFCKGLFLSFESLAAIKNIQLEFKSDIAIDKQIISDENKLEKIINNLVSNAIKYSNSDSVIYFELMQENNYLSIKVKDQGLGIPSEEREKVFNRFYQAKNSKNIGGIGIGLSLSKKFAELLNGDLTVNSKLGKGSIFQLAIPYVSAKKIEEKKSIEVLETKEYSAESVQKPKVLVVEDNVEMSNFLVEILQEKYHCATAFNGEEALKKIKNTSFDLITSDIMMPKIDGFKFKEALSENKRYKSIPFVFISAKSLEEDKLKGFDLGIDDYIVKPFNKNELLARVKNLIENKKSREQWSIENKDLLEESIVSFDKKIIDKAEKAVLDNLSNENYKVVDLALEIGYSQRQLTRFLKQYTGMSPVKFILEIRLQKAYVLLQQKAFLTLSEVKYEIGITSTSYFNKKFKERFGVLPNEV